MGENRQGLAFAVLVGEPVEISFSGIITLEKKDGSFGKGPFEMSIADFLTVGAVLFAVGLFGAFDEPAVGDEILD